MKQMDECLVRAFNQLPPKKSSKWKAIITMHGEYEPVLYLFHYQHRVLVYAINHHQILDEWWEKPADKRGLDSAKEWLRAYQVRSLVENVHCINCGDYLPDEKRKYDELCDGCAIEYDMDSMQVLLEEDDE